ncbi:hypothetical protein FKB33_05890 [Enterococcus faecium]|nr:hypothetical protein [Enterococcus faecium]
MKSLEQNKTKCENLMRFIETTPKAHFTDSEMVRPSVVVAYYLLLSLFPLIIALVHFTFLHIDQETVLTYLREVILRPFTSLSVLQSKTFDTKFRRLVIRSALAVVWSASQSITALQIAMNKAYGVENRKILISPFLPT